MPSHPDRVRRNYDAPVAPRHPYELDEGTVYELIDPARQHHDYGAMMRGEITGWNGDTPVVKWTQMPKHYSVGLGLDGSGNVVELAKAIDATMTEPTPDTPWGV